MILETICIDQLERPFYFRLNNYTYRIKSIDCYKLPIEYNIYQVDHDFTRDAKYFSHSMIYIKKGDKKI